MNTALATLLSKHLRAAIEYGMSTFICTNNLRIKIEISQNKVILTIWRFSCYPKDSEWHTVLNAFPYFVNAIARHENTKGFYKLTADLGPLQDYLF